MTLGQALAAVQPGLLSKTVDEVLRIADAPGRSDHGPGKNAQEHSVWAAINELRTAHGRPPPTPPCAAPNAGMPSRSSSSGPLAA
jgi:hypothetical protein